MEDSSSWLILIRRDFDMHTLFVNYISILTLFLIVDMFSSLWDKYPGKCGKSTIFTWSEIRIMFLLCRSLKYCKKITHSNSVTQASHWCELKAISLIHDSGLESIWSGLSAGSNSLCLKLICIFQQGCPIHLSYLNL